MFPQKIEWHRAGAQMRGDTPAQALASRRLRILCVDDEPVQSRTFARMLKGMDVEVTFASSLAESRSLLFGPERRPFDLAVIDFFLAGKERGTTLVPEIRKHLPGTAILVISAAPELLEMTTLDQPPFAWMSKSGVARDAHTTIRKVMAQHEASLRESTPEPVPLAEVKGAYAREVLKLCNGNRSEAARKLQIGRKTLRRILGEEGDEGQDGGVDSDDDGEND